MTISWSRKKRVEYRDEGSHALLEPHPPPHGRLERCYREVYGRLNDGYGSSGSHWMAQQESQITPAAWTTPQKVYVPANECQLGTSSTYVPYAVGS
jgi:hypothetical protein